jgi:hypothetical protein
MRDIKELRDIKQIKTLSEFKMLCDSYGYKENQRFIIKSGDVIARDTREGKTCQFLEFKYDYRGCVYAEIRLIGGHRRESINIDYLSLI